MKHHVFFLISSLFFTTITAQVIFQEGLVRELNSKNKPVSGVFIKFEDASSTNSDDNGHFRLTFQDKEVNELIFLDEIRKSGYQLVNEKDFEIITISGNQRLVVDIVLAKKGVVEAAKKEYYNISDKALLAGFEQEKDELRAKLTAAELNQADYRSQYNSLKEQYDRQKSSLDTLAAKFARVNFDDEEHVYKAALLLFKKGKISKAIAKLQRTNPSEITEKILAEDKRLAEAQNEIDSQKATLAINKSKQIKTIRLLVDMYNVSFELEKVENQYDQLLLLDSMNLELLQEAGDFFRIQHRYAKAKRCYSLILTQPEANKEQLSDAYLFLGDLYTITGSLSDALAAYQSGFEAIVIHHNLNPSLFIKEKLANFHSKLGDTHSSLGDFQKALTSYGECLALTTAIFRKDSTSVAVKNSLAVSYEKMGKIHRSMDEHTLALSYFEKYNELAEELYAAYPDNSAIKNNLAISYSKLGVTYSSLGDFNRAMTFYQQYYLLKQELHETFPENVDFKYGFAVSSEKMGFGYHRLKNNSKALTYYQRFNELLAELYADYPENVNFKYSLAISNKKLGDVNIAQSNLEKAILHYEKELELTQELYDDDPVNQIYKDGLASSNTGLGYIYQAGGYMNKAGISFEQGMRLTKELYEVNPQDLDYKNALASSYLNLGVYQYRYFKNKDMAKSYLKLAQILWQELAAELPEVSQFHDYLFSISEMLLDLE